MFVLKTAICLEQISKRQAGIFNSIRDSEQVAESNYLKISNSVSDWDKMRASKVFTLPGFITIWIAKIQKIQNCKKYTF